MKPNLSSIALILTAAMLCSASVFAGDETDAKSQSPIVQTGTVSHDLFSMEVNYTGESNVRQAGVIGKQDALLSDFTYNHRFQIEGNWYLRLGMEYERFDFESVAPLPRHLQAISALVAAEYVVQDFAAVSVELRPGFAFENDISGHNFAVPIDAYTAFPIMKDKLFGMVGVFYGQNFKPEVAPIGGIIWLINDKVRLQALFPRSALVYNLNDDWDLSLNGRVDGYGFRTDVDGRAPATYQNARVEYDYSQAGVSATYKGWKPFNVTLGGGYSFNREFDFIDYGPGQKYKAAGAPYIQLSIDARF